MITMPKKGARVWVGYGALRGREATVTRTDIMAKDAVNVRADNGETDTLHISCLRLVKP